MNKPMLPSYYTCNDVSIDEDSDTINSTPPRTPPFNSNNKLRAKTPGAPRKPKALKWQFRPEYSDAMSDLEL
jgi:hypothetical protein